MTDAPSRDTTGARATRRAPLVIGGLLGLALLGAVVVAASDSRDPADRRSSAGIATVFAGAAPAAAPFGGLTEVELSVGGRCLRVVVADAEDERVQGLRGRSDTGPYDAMAFAFPSSTDVAFTMSTVPVALDVAFYRADGSPVSRRRMAPCPKVESECPAYRSTGSFRYALEAPAGELPAGPLARCPG